MILEILSFDGWTPDVIEVLKMFERTGDKILHERLRNCVGQEYKPYDLLFGSDRISCLTSSGEISLEKRKNQAILISWDNPYDCFWWVVYSLVWYQHLQNVFFFLVWFQVDEWTAKPSPISIQGHLLEFFRIMAAKTLEKSVSLTDSDV